MYLLTSCLFLSASSVSVFSCCWFRQQQPVQGCHGGHHGQREATFPVNILKWCKDGPKSVFEQRQGALFWARNQVVFVAAHTRSHITANFWVSVCIRVRLCGPIEESELQLAVFSHISTSLPFWVVGCSTNSNLTISATCARRCFSRVVPTWCTQVSCCGLVVVD